MKKLPFFLALILLLAFFTACGTVMQNPQPSLLPTAEPDTNSQFGVDKNINIDTIDNWLGRDDVVYRDVRMLFDPADYAAIGGDADLSRTIENFIQRLVGTSKSDFDGWAGYCSQLSCVDSDAVSGATVTTSNVTSMLQSLFAYHEDKYYGEESK